MLSEMTKSQMAVAEDFTRGWLELSADQPQQCRLARPVLTQYANAALQRHIKRHVSQHGCLQGRLQRGRACGHCRKRCGCTERCLGISRYLCVKQSTSWLWNPDLLRSKKDIHTDGAVVDEADAAILVDAGRTGVATPAGTDPCAGYENDTLDSCSRAAFMPGSLTHDIWQVISQ